MRNTLSNLFLLKISTFQKALSGKMVCGLLFMVATAALPVAHGAETSDSTLYRETLSLILKFEKPDTFAVWEKQIDAETMEAIRVPRQNPYHQFSRSLKGLDLSLEKTLMTPGGDVEADKQLPKFTMPVPIPVSANFLGFFGIEEIKRAQINAKPGDFHNWTTLVGFSKVAYGNDGRSALLYAETCSLGPDDGCGGRAFWFVQGKNGWQLKRQVSLWDGSLAPLWEVQPSTAHPVAN